MLHYIKIQNPENPQRRLPKPKYSNMTPPPSHTTRASDDQPCPCTACAIARCNIYPGHFLTNKTTPLAEKFWKLLFPEETFPALKSYTTTMPPVEKRCTSCQALVGKGRLHKCTKKDMQDNLHKMVRGKSLKSKEKIGSKIIKDLFDAKDSSKKGGTVLLATGGPLKLPISLSIRINKVRFSHENLRRLQVVMGQSDRGIK